MWFNELKAKIFNFNLGFNFDLKWGIVLFIPFILSYGLSFEKFKGELASGYKIYEYTFYVFTTLYFLTYLFLYSKLKRKEQQIYEKYCEESIFKSVSRFSECAKDFETFKFKKIFKYFDRFEKFELVLVTVFILLILVLFKDILSYYWKGNFNHFYFIEGFFAFLMYLVVYIEMEKFKTIGLKNLFNKVLVEKKCFEVFEHRFIDGYRWADFGFIFLMWCFFIGVSIFYVDIKSEYMKDFIILNLIFLGACGYFLISLINLFGRYDILLKKLDEFCEICKEK